MENELELICSKCGETLDNRLCLKNFPENCTEKNTFIHMKIGESMHLECYIEQIIDKYYEKK